MNEPQPIALQAPLAALFAIGEWRADPSANAIMRGDESVSLEPKVMDLLALLASAPARTFTRDELDGALWPGVTVGDDTLARTVSKLRAALGDTAGAPRYIETIPKRGYRLIAAVTTEPGAPAPPPRRARLILAGLLAAAAAVVTVMMAVRQPVLTPSNGSQAAEKTSRADDLYMNFTRADNEAAIVLYERVLAADPAYAPAQSGLANALVQRAIRWQSAPGAAPSATSLQEALARGVTQGADAQAMLQRAVGLGERAVRLAPKNADALKALGFAYSAQGDLTKAREIYRRAVRIDDDAWEVMINLGELETIGGAPQAARDWFERAYATMDRLYAAEPQRIGSWRAPLGVLIGAAYEAEGDGATAEVWYRRVLDQAPLDAEATARLASLLRNRGAIAEADRLCRALVDRIAEDASCGADVESD